MIGVDLFSGAGGLSLGAVNAGIKVVLAVELDRWAASTYRENFPDTHVVEQDVGSLSTIPIHSDGDEKILFGGPPCRGFSTSNQRTRSLSNPVNGLYRHLLRLARSWLPDWVVLENVGGILATAGGEVVKDITRMLRDVGYETHIEVLNSRDFGVPQDRTRVFVVARRGSEPPRTIPRQVSASTTVHEAIGDLPPLENGARFSWLPYSGLACSEYAEALRSSEGGCGGHYVTKNSQMVIARYRHIRPGGNWRDVPVALMSNYKDRTRCHTGIYRRLRDEEVASVIGNYRKNMLIHPTQDRGLSVREAARLQSFPDWFEFSGSIGFQQQQVGNAVPPLLANAVFSGILEAETKSMNEGAGGE